MRIINTLILLALMASNLANAQNARFSQVSSIPVNFNPALSGRFDGQGRAIVLSSWQKTENAYAPHQSIYIDYKLGKYMHMGDDLSTDEMGPSDSSFLKLKKPAKDISLDGNKGSKIKNGFWSVGGSYYQYGKDLMGIYDQTTPVLARFYGLHLARHFELNKQQYAGVGLQAVYANATLDERVGTDFDREIYGGAFRYSNKNANNRVSKNDYFDFNVGAYYGMITEPLAFELGISMYHLFYPKNDIFVIDDETKLRHRMTLHSVLRFKLNDTWGLLQKNMYWAEGLYWKSTSFYDSAHIIALYTGFEVFKTKPKSFYNVNLGFYSRSFRTLMPMINLNLGRSLFCRLTYEFPVNSDKFNAYTAERTEISLVYSYNRKTQTGNRFYKKFNYW